jgi:hypothetical protein
LGQSGGKKRGNATKINLRARGKNEGLFQSHAQDREMTIIALTRVVTRRTSERVSLSPVRYL